MAICSWSVRCAEERPHAFSLPQCSSMLHSSLFRSSLSRILATKTDLNA
jgi:hypothetical protein